MWTVSKHARQRAAEMHVTLDEIVQCAQDPEFDYPSPKHPGARTAVRGRIATPYVPTMNSERGGKILTVVWNTEKKYERGDAVIPTRETPTDPTTPAPGVAVPKKKGGKGRGITDCRALIELAREQGWTVTRSAGNQWKLRTPDGSRIYVIRDNGDRRGFLNGRAALKRMGLRLPQ